MGSASPHFQLFKLIAQPSILAITKITIMRNITPNRLVLSYILDWIVIMYAHLPCQNERHKTNKHRIIAAIGYTWSNQTPIHRPFSLTDPNISYPETKHEKVPFELALALALILPALIIALVIVLRIPGQTLHKDTPRSIVWRYKLWEINAGWLGIALAVASAYATAKGLKLLFGKPRPDLLARCDPDLENVAAYVVSGLGEVLPGAPVLVASEICRNKSHGLTKTGFVSFPSDHASCEFLH